MGVYIKGMEMPDDGAYFCEVGVIDGVGTIVFHTEERQVFRLIEVPPHGRLGDLDALAAQCDDPHWCVWLNEIEDAPTIIEAEEET